MATINPSQDYDIIHTLTYASSGGTNTIRLRRGSSGSFTGTVYYRAGTSGTWTPLSVSGTSTTFPITSTTMQIAHNWNKSGNNYMTPSFEDGTMTGIAISQKAVLSGVMGNHFMYKYARDCSNLTTLAIPDTSGLTSVGNSFMADYARDCSGLTTMAIPDTSGLTSVGDEFMSYYANDCSSLTTLAVPDTSGLTSVGTEFMADYARDCSGLTTLAIPDTSGLTSAGSDFMANYANDCSSLTQLILPKAGWFKTNNVNWDVPSSRLGSLVGNTTNPTDQADWQALTVSGETLHTNYIRNSSDVRLSIINPSQDYDIIHTLTYASSGGTNSIRLFRGSFEVHAGTVYYRAGTSGAWTSLSVSGYDTTFPITSTTMQIAHNWNKSGNSYMTPSFQGGTMTGITISQKAVLSGVMGDYFMYSYAYGPNLTTMAVPDTSGLTSAGDFFMSSYAYFCSSLTTLEVPDTSGLTSVGARFMSGYASFCDNLTTLAAPDTSGLTSVGSYFMNTYAFLCESLTTLAIPDTSGLTSVGDEFMSDYALFCSSLTQLILPKAGWFKTNNVNWGVPSGRLGLLRGKTSNPTDTTDWQALTVSGETLHTNYIRNSSLVGESFDTGPVNTGAFLQFF